MQPGASLDERPEKSVLHQVEKHPARARIDVEGDARCDLPPFDHPGCDGEITESRIGGGADIRLVNWLAGNLAHWHHVVRTGGLGDQRMQAAEVDLVVIVIVGIRRRRKRPPVARAAVSSQECSCHFVGGEHRRRRSKLGAHIGNDVPVHCAQARKAWTIIFDDAADPALHAMATKHLQDDILGAHPFGKRPHQANAHDHRHTDVQRFPREHRGDVAASGSDCQHAERPCGAGVAVGADQECPRNAESFHVDRMTDAVAGPAEPNAEAT